MAVHSSEELAMSVVHEKIRFNSVQGADAGQVSAGQLFDTSAKRRIVRRVLG